MMTGNFTLSLATWCLLLAAACPLMTVRIDHAKDRTRGSGIEITQKLAKCFSLPFFETNGQAIQTLPAYAATKIGQIYTALSPNETLRIRNQFRIVVGSSCPIFLLLVAAFLYQIWPKKKTSLDSNVKSYCGAARFL